MNTIKIKLSVLILALTATALTVSASGEKDAPTLMQQNVIEDEHGNQMASVFGSDYDPESIQTITFLDTLTNMSLDAWDVSEAQDDSVMAWVTPTDDKHYDLYIAGDGDSVNAPADCSYLFAFPNLKTINFNDCFLTDTADNMSYMFYQCRFLEDLNVSNFDTTNVTNMDWMFCYCNSLEALDVRNFDTSNVINMKEMFRDCTSLEELDVSNFDTTNVTDMCCMFRRCISLKELDLSNFDTSNVIDISSMFSECYSLDELDLSNFDTSNVIDMGGMFSACTSLEALDLSNFDTFNVTEMNDMFYACTSLEALDLSNFDTSNVTDMREMFCDCTSLKALDISNFDTQSLIFMDYMLTGCISLENVEDGDSGLYETLILTGGVSIFSLEDFKKTVATNSPEMETSGYVVLPEDYNKIEVPEAVEINVPSAYIDERLEEDCQKSGIEFTSAKNITDEEAAEITGLRYQTAEDYLNAVTEQLTFFYDFGYDLEIFSYMFESISDDIEYMDIPEDNDLKFEALIMQMAADAGITEPSDDAYEILMAEEGLFNYDDLYNVYTADELIENLYYVTVVEEIVPVEIVVTFEGYDFEVKEMKKQEETETASETDENTEEVSENISRDNANTGEDFSAEQDQTEIVTAENTEDENGSSTIDIEQDYGDWVEYDSDAGSFYSGFEKDGEFNGWGNYTFSDGAMYEGQFEDGVLSGFGTYILPDNIMYIGEVYDGERCGIGVSFYPDDDYMSIGEIDDNGLNGLAVELGDSIKFGIYEDNVCVEDGSENCQQNDDGSMYYWVDPDNSSGENKGIVMNTDDLRIGIYPEGTSGKSLEFRYDGDLYIGDLNNDVYEGEGVYYYNTSDDIMYAVGSFENGEFTQGVMKHSDGSWEIGQFQNDVYVEGSGITSDDV